MPVRNSGMSESDINIYANVFLDCHHDSNQRNWWESNSIVDIQCHSSPKVNMYPFFIEDIIVWKLENGGFLWDRPVR